MRTNKECPLYHRLEGSASTAPVTVAMSEEQEEALEKTDLIDQDLINVEGTKVTISKQLVKQCVKFHFISLVHILPVIGAGLDIGYVPAVPHAFLGLSGQFGPLQLIFHWPECFVCRHYFYWESAKLGRQH